MRTGVKASAAALAVLLVLLQYPLWLGRGGWLRVWELDRKVSAQRGANVQLRQRNETLEAEVRDLKSGYEAIEERARYELGLVRADEIFIQLISPPGAAPAPSSHPAERAGAGAAGGSPGTGEPAP